MYKWGSFDLNAACKNGIAVQRQGEAGNSREGKKLTVMKGQGTVIAVHANGGYCSVRWDNGQEEKVVFTGQRVSATCFSEFCHRVLPAEYCS